MVSKGQFMGLDWNRITRLHSQVMTGTQSPVAQWLEHPTRSTADKYLRQIKVPSLSNNSYCNCNNTTIPHTIGYHNRIWQQAQTLHYETVYKSIVILSFLALTWKP